MVQMIEDTIVHDVVSAARGLGYDVVVEPAGRNWHKALSSKIGDLVGTNPPRPDLLIKNGDLSAVVEVKIHGVLFSPVMQVMEYADAFKAHGVICVPDNIFPGIPESVSEYAKNERIEIIPTSKVEETLRSLLQN